MKPKNKAQANDIARNLVLAPGAADESEGLVYLDECSVASCVDPVEKRSAGEKSAVAYKTYVEQQPGEGFWSVAPGCGDISEGRVWVVKVKQ